jgi:putative SOS response-associated peptidase YedK
MCGRVILTLSAKMIREIMAEEYDITQLHIDDFMPLYNVGPSQNMLSVIKHDDTYRSGYLKWRFIPSYAKTQNEGYKYINARSETVHEKRTYKEAFEKRRCLLICNGFYEWKRDKVKRPFLFHRENFNLIVMAGIWQAQYLDDGSKEYGFSILTTAANEVMAPIHHRMPVILKATDVSLWLDKNASYDDIKHLFKPIDEAYLTCYEVSPYINSLKNQDDFCIEKAVSPLI